MRRNNGQSKSRSVSRKTSPKAAIAPASLSTTANPYLIGVGRQTDLDRNKEESKSGSEYWAMGEKKVRNGAESGDK